jgi:hypothetical protein
MTGLSGPVADRTQDKEEPDRNPERERHARDPFDAFRHTVEILTSFRLLREPARLTPPIDQCQVPSSHMDMPVAQMIAQEKNLESRLLCVTGISGRIVQHTLNPSSSRRWRGMELQSWASCFRAEGGFRVWLLGHSDI